MIAKGNAKVDLLDLQKNYMSQYGENDVNMEPLRKIEMITFKRMSNGYIGGYFGGRKVYRDKDSEQIIGENETWFCKLVNNPRSMGNYFAEAVCKVDANFLIDLSGNKYDELVNHVWNKYRETIESDLEYKYIDWLEEKARKMADKEVVELHKLITDLMDELNASKLKMEESESKAEEYGLKYEDACANNHLLTEKIMELESKLETLSSEREELVSRFEKMKHKVIPDNIEASYDQVIRSDPNTLYSKRFVDSKYIVRFASKGKTLYITPDENGNVTCSDNTIRLRGLDVISEFKSPTEVCARFDTTDGIIINLM